MSTPVGTILNDPLYSAILVLVLAGVGVAIRRYLKPSDASQVGRLRRKWMVVADRFTSAFGFPLVVTKGPSEYVGTVDMGRDLLAEKMYEEGYVLNPISTLKSRESEGVTDYSVLSMKYSEPGSNRMWHFYAFPVNGSLDLYQHGETDWDPTEGGNPAGHLDPSGDESMEQIGGDPEDVLTHALERQGINIYERQALNE